MTSNGGANYTYNGESQLATAGGATYTYDGDGNRVKKSSGTLYWGSGPLVESDLNGTASSLKEYIMAGGRRIARRDNVGTGNVFFYLSDNLGSSREIVASGASSACYDADFYPYGGERAYTNTCPQNYKFTGKERDSESGLDNFKARYDSSNLGRFMSPDPLLSSGRPGNPQTWNRYAYALNNPLSSTDPTGLYTCSGTKDQCRDFKNALGALKASRDSYDKKSNEYKVLNAALSAYGKANVDNGVHVGFGPTKNGGPADTKVGLSADTKGNKITTADNPAGQDINVTIDPSKNGNTTDEAINAAHEGTHVAEGSALVGALPTNLVGPDAQGVLDGALNLTKYQTETDAYMASSFAAEGLNVSSYAVGNGHMIWNASWAAADVQTMRSAGIREELADPEGLYHVTPDNQGTKLIH
jgi:RHS repeat-associated protein